MKRNLYDIARDVTDGVLGAGSYARLNGRSPDPEIRAAAARGRRRLVSVSADDYSFNLQILWPRRLRRMRYRWLCKHGKHYWVGGSCTTRQNGVFGMQHSLECMHCPVENHDFEPQPLTQRTL